MDKKTKLFYLQKTKAKVNDIIQHSNVYFYINDAKMYINQLLDILRLLEQKYLCNIKDIKITLEMILTMLNNQDYYNAKELLTIKIKELDPSDKHI